MGVVTSRQMHYQYTWAVSCIHLLLKTDVAGASVDWQHITNKNWEVSVSGRLQQQ